MRSLLLLPPVREPELDIRRMLDPQFRAQSRGRSPMCGGVGVLGRWPSCLSGWTLACSSPAGRSRTSHGGVGLGDDRASCGWGEWGVQEEGCTMNRLEGEGVFVTVQVMSSDTCVLDALASNINPTSVFTLRRAWKFPGRGESTVSYPGSTAEIHPQLVDEPHRLRRN